jgi:hypothetical protein
MNHPERPYPASPAGEAGHDAPPSEASGAFKPPIEIGIVLAGPFDDIDRPAIGRAITHFQSELAAAIPTLEWRIRRLRRVEGNELSREEPSRLLQAAAEDRDRHHWDFALSITPAQLSGHYRPYCFAALSRPLDAAVISTALIDPIVSDAESDATYRQTAITRRLKTLMLHAIAHLAGLQSQDAPSSLMYHPDKASQLDAMQDLSQDERAELERNLQLVADIRLEESPRATRSRWGFFLYASWINRHEILNAIWAARPWQFPIRLSRLTTAAVSSVAILLMTAEAWDLGLDQPWTRLVGLALLTNLSTTAFVTIRQQLLVRRNQRHTEQTVVTSVSSFLIVITGMLTTWLSMLVLALLISGLLFDGETIRGWAANASLENPQAALWLRLRMSWFTASLAILIGALGASFESQAYFRHIILVDEEL